MKILDHEKPLAEWLAANHPDVLKAYENYVGADLDEVYFLDLQSWLGTLVEYDLKRYRESREALY